MNVLAYPSPSGSRFWRLDDPFKYVRELGIDAQVSDEPITDKAAKWADIVILQSTINKEGIALLRAYQQLHGLKIVVESDDLLELNDDNPHAVEHKIRDAQNVIKITMEIADAITTTTKPLLTELAKINSNVYLLPNYMDMKRWDLPKNINSSSRIRIGWAGSTTHLNDLRYIAPALIKAKMEYPQIDYIFVGDPRVKELFPFSVECIMGVPFEMWPAKLHSLRLDIALAPLLDTPFNRCKSKIKFMEYAIAKYPGIYSPTVYREKGNHDFDPKFGIVAEDQDHWYRAIKHLIDYPQRRKEIRENAYNLVKRRYNLEKHAQEWVKVFKDVDMK